MERSDKVVFAASDRALSIAASNALSVTSCELNFWLEINEKVIKAP